MARRNALLEGLMNGLAQNMKNQNDMRTERERRRMALEEMLSQNEAVYQQQQRRRPGEFAQRLDEERMLAEQQAGMSQKHKEAQVQALLGHIRRVRPDLEKDPELMKRVEAKIYGFADLIPQQLPDHLAQLVGQGKIKEAYSAAKTPEERSMVEQMAKFDRELNDFTGQIVGNQAGTFNKGTGKWSFESVPGVLSDAAKLSIIHGGGRSGGDSSGRVARYVNVTDPVTGKKRLMAVDKYGREVMTDLPEFSGLDEEEAMIDQEISDLNSRFDNLQKNYVPTGETLNSWASQMGDGTGVRSEAKKSLGRYQELMNRKGQIRQQRFGRGGSSAQPAQPSRSPGGIISSVIGGIGRASSQIADNFGNVPMRTGAQEMQAGSQMNQPKPNRRRDALLSTEKEESNKWKYETRDPMLEGIY